MADVTLFRYDLTGGMAASLSPMLLGERIEAIWHTSLVFYGREYFFDGGVGIISEVPRSTRFGAPMRTESLGVSQKTQSDFLQWVARERATRFGPYNYNLLQRNCNHFTNEAAMFLLGRGIPRDICDMIPRLMSTPLGQMVRPMLERMTEGPVSSGGVPSFASASATAPPPAAAPVQPQEAAASRGLLSARQGLTDAEKEDVHLALAILESSQVGACSSGPENGAVRRRMVACLDMLVTILGRIIDNPTVVKYRSINQKSNSYVEVILPFEENGVRDILTIAGFKDDLVAGESQSATRHWRLSDECGSVRVLKGLVTLLSQASDSIKQELSQQNLRSQHTPEVVIAEAPPTTAALTTTLPSKSTLLKYVAPALVSASASVAPLVVGHRRGEKMYAIVATDKSNLNTYGRQGKCTSMGADGWEAHCSGRDGKEERCRRFEILCGPVPPDRPGFSEVGTETDLVWLPASLVLSSAVPPTHLVRVGGMLSICYACMPDGGLHPGYVDLESKKCYVPYGGDVVCVTATAWVLCVLSVASADVLSQAATLRQVEAAVTSWRKQVCAPIGSFSELLAWRGFEAETNTMRAAGWNCTNEHVPLRPRATAGGAHHARGRPPQLLVCHDMRGGYRDPDAPCFTYFPDGEGGDLASDAYTPEYLHLVDYFVYFSHHRVSVPPREWIDLCHRNGVPVLGTLLTEAASGQAELDDLLASPERMGAVVQKLVEVAGFYRFDGYLINFENAVSALHAKRIVYFLSALRQQLKKRAEADAGAHAGLVIWYDAVTKDGVLQYQNALTEKNAPFFAACDGIFTNYFWRPGATLSRSRAMAQMARPPGGSGDSAGDRSRDVFVGVDVFGRGTYGGGGFACDTAVCAAVADEGMSAALFAPGWTLETHSKGSRQAYLAGEQRLWGSLERLFQSKVPLGWLPFASGRGETNQSEPESRTTRTLPQLLYRSTFRSAAANGASFYVNGRPALVHLGLAGSHSVPPVGSSWCQLSAQELLPSCLRFVAPSVIPDGMPASSPVRSLPVIGAIATGDPSWTFLDDGAQPGAAATLASGFDWPAWHGDRSLALHCRKGMVVQIAEVAIPASTERCSVEGGTGGFCAVVDVAARIGCTSTELDLSAFSLCITGPAQQAGDENAMVTTMWSLTDPGAVDPPSLGDTAAWRLWPSPSCDGDSNGWAVWRCCLPLHSPPSSGFLPEQERNAAGTPGAMPCPSAVGIVCRETDAVVQIGGLCVSLHHAPCAFHETVRGIRSPLVSGAAHQVAAWRECRGVSALQRYIHFQVAPGPAWSGRSNHTVTLMAAVRQKNIGSTTSPPAAGAASEAVSVVNVVYLGEHTLHVGQQGQPAKGVVALKTPESVAIDNVYALYREAEW